MDAILFIHHKPLNEPVTKKHLILFKAFNRDSEVVPLAFESGRETVEWRQRNTDLLMYEWFERSDSHHERVFVVEWDTFPTCSLREFFGCSYDKSVVGATIVRPWSNEVMMLDKGGFSQRQRDWHWFVHNESAELHPFLRGIVPASVVMFSHDALFNMVQLFKTVPAFKNLQNECRMGTLAAMAGYEPVEIRPDCARWINCADVEIDQGPGIYHRVRA
jgi:hypothetical protein